MMCENCNEGQQATYECETCCVFICDDCFNNGEPYDHTDCEYQRLDGRDAK